MPAARRNIFADFPITPIFMFNDLAHFGGRFAIFPGKDDRLGVGISIGAATIIECV
jgi:hypothetical protein